MGEYKNFFLERLAIINYNIAIHEGNANERLASQSIKILLLPLEEVPNHYKNQFKELLKMIKDESKELPKGISFNKFLGKHNKTAVKYIKLLIEIYDIVKE